MLGQGCTSQAWDFMLTGNTYDMGPVAPVPVLSEWQQWEPHGARLHLLEMRLRLQLLCLLLYFTLDSLYVGFHWLVAS